MNDERLMKVLVAPHVSEKSTRLNEAANQVVFKVLPDARKLEIKHAVEKLFSVEVVEVQVTNVKGKRKGAGPRAGRPPRTGAPQYRTTTSRVCGGVARR